MPNEITKYEALDGTQVALSVQDAREHFCPQASDKDVVKFLAISRSMGANPFAGETYLVGYQGRDGFQASILTSVHFMNRVAQGHPDYDGIASGIVTLANGDLCYRQGAMLVPGEQLVGGWAEVYSKERSHPFRAEVSLAEYNTGRSLWKSKPATMIEKVAKAQAWRGAYPGSFSGVYTSDEVSERQAAPQPVHAQVQQPTPKPGYPAEDLAVLKGLTQAVAERGGDYEGTRMALWSTYTSGGIEAAKAHAQQLGDAAEAAQDEQGVEPDEIELGAQQ